MHLEFKLFLGSVHNKVYVFNIVVFVIHMLNVHPPTHSR